MRRPPPPLAYIRSFECAARHLSFTRAAEELGFTQAAISLHVRGLERYIGRPLFVRKARSLELTELGEAFLPTLRQALGQIDLATEAVVSGSREESVVLSCPFSLAESWLPHPLAAFRAEHPEIEILVYGSVWSEPTEEIADLVISMHRSDEVPRGAELLWAERLVLVAAPDLAAGLDEAAHAASLPRILISGRQEFWSIMSGRLGFSPEQAAPMIRTNSSNVALAFAARGLGLAVSLESLAEPLLARGDVIEPFAIRPESPWSYYLSHRSTDPTRSSCRLAETLKRFACSPLVADAAHDISFGKAGD